MCPFSKVIGSQTSLPSPLLWTEKAIINATIREIILVHVSILSLGDLHRYMQKVMEEEEKVRRIKWSIDVFNPTKEKDTIIYGIKIIMKKIFEKKVVV